MNMGVGYQEQFDVQSFMGGGIIKNYVNLPSLWETSDQEIAK